jgi:hypothetical protein
LEFVNDTKPEASSTTFCRELDDFIKILGEMLLPDLVRELEEESITPRPR